MHPRLVNTLVTLFTLFTLFNGRLAQPSGPASCSPDRPSPGRVRGAVPPWTRPYQRGAGPRHREKTRAPRTIGLVSGC